MKRIMAVVLGLLLVTQTALVWADSDPEESTLSQVGVGTGSVVGSVIYFPVKSVFCVVGGGLGALYTSVFIGPEATHEVLSTTCRGTWAITPSTLRGKESITFIGDVPPYGYAESPQDW